MREHGVGSLAVVDGKRLVGMITDRDIALAVLCDSVDPDTTSVADVMRSNPVSIRLTTTASEAADTMRRSHVRRLPVVSPNDQVAGVVTHDDLVVQLAARLQSVGGILRRQLLPEDTGGLTPKAP